MYLSKVVLQGVRSPYQWHQSLWGLFESDPEASRTFLFRCEKNLRGGVEILMQSQQEPRGHSAQATVLATKPFQPGLCRGQPLRFRLVANPVKTIRDERGRLDNRGRVKTCRVPLLAEVEQLDWLARKLTGAADLEEARVNGRWPLHFRKGGQAGKVVQVVFEGLLRVQDPDGLQRVLTQGIGPAKAFGCGLLSLARAG